VNLLGLSPVEALVVDVLAWTVLGVATGYLAHRLPVRWLERDLGPLRLAAFERGGTWYERRLHVKRWKHRLPDAGLVFRGGQAKADLVRPDRTALAAFAVETRRAEIVHLCLLVAGPLFVLWNPWDLALVMIAYAVVANLPCLVVQRYNRTRVLAILED
jgi:glycosyl-4,4'-diaponeurosporenoate acyltransferase